jgi:replicative DNA helicase
MTEIADAPLLINSTPGATMSALCDQIAKDHAEEPLQLVAIDPLNMIDPMLSNDANRERQVSHVVRRLKVLALELDVPVLVTAELGRSVDQRVDRRPNLGDFRDSDTISQVADNVILLYRPDAFDRDDPRGGEAD